MDVGKDVRKRGSSKAIAKLAETVQGMMSQWTEDNFGMFEETMELIREGAPVQWVRLYLDAVKMGIVKEANINININRQQDREALQGLAKARLLPNSIVYTPYEAIKPEQIPVDKGKKEEEF
jgi:hypothetical protein